MFDKRGAGLLDRIAIWTTWTTLGRSWTQGTWSRRRSLAFLKAVLWPHCSPRPTPIGAYSPSNDECAALTSSEINEQGRRRDGEAGREDRNYSHRARIVAASAVSICSLYRV
jgi:hypothetical protein